MATISYSGLDDDVKLTPTTAPPGATTAVAGVTRNPAGAPAAKRSTLLPQADDQEEGGGGPPRDPNNTLRDDLDRRLGRAPQRVLKKRLGAVYPRGEFRGLSRSQATTKIMEDNNAFGGGGSKPWMLDAIPPRNPEPGGAMSDATRATAVSDFRNSPAVAGVNRRQQQSDALNNAGETWKNYLTAPPATAPPVAAAVPGTPATRTPATAPVAAAASVPGTPATRTPATAPVAAAASVPGTPATRTPAGAPVAAAVTPPRDLSWPTTAANTSAVPAPPAQRPKTPAPLTRGPGFLTAQAGVRVARAKLQAGGAAVRDKAIKGAAGVGRVLGSPVAQTVLNPIDAAKRLGRRIGTTARDLLY